jgi:predicted permease
MMNELLATLTIVGFFILRLGIPILLIILVGYLMSRLDARWQMHS